MSFLLLGLTNPLQDLTFFFFWGGRTLRHMEVPKLGVKLQLPAYTTATAMPDLCHVWDHATALSNASWVLNLLSHNRNFPRFEF